VVARHLPNPVDTDRPGRNDETLNTANQGLGDEPMLDGIVMNMVHVPGIIGVISDLMFPKALLPHGKLPLLMRSRPPP
jgi:hypothetical protein